VTSTDSRLALRHFVYLLLFVAATAALALFGIGRVSLTPESVRAAVVSWGPLAPIVFVLLFALRPFMLFPSTLLFIAAGLAFGPAFGTVLAVVGATLAGVITFGIARWLGRDFVQAHLPARVKRLQDEHWGFGLVLLLNLVPIVSLTAVNYAAGVSELTLAHYATATAIGLTPRIFAFASFGDSLLNIGSRQFRLALALLALLIVVPLALRRYWTARKPRGTKQ